MIQKSLAFASQARTLDHSPTFVMRTLPSGCPRTETLSNRAAAYKPERNRLRLRSSVPTPSNIEVLTDFQPVNAVGDLAVLARLLDSRTEIGSAAARCSARLPHEASTTCPAGTEPWASIQLRRRRPNAVDGLAISSQSPCCFVGENFPIPNQPSLMLTSSEPPSLSPISLVGLLQSSSGRRLTSFSSSWAW